MIYGYYNSHHIVNNTPDNFWPIFKDQSIIPEDEFFEYYENVDSGIAIQLSDLKLFEHPFKVPNYNNTDDYSYLEKIDSLKFLLNF